MEKLQNEFPLIELYKKHFNITEKTIFALTPDIYTNYKLTPDLLIHEQTHLKQQEKIGADKWVDKYINNIDFRIEQEVEAYKNQVKSIKDRNIRERVKVWASETLSGELYQNIITKQKAYELLK